MHTYLFIYFGGAKILCYWQMLILKEPFDHPKEMFREKLKIFVQN